MSRIVSVEAFALRPAEPSYQVAAGRGTLYPKVMETLLVRLETEDGTVGWGEGLAPVAANVPAAIVTDLMTPALLGAEATAIRPLRGRLVALMHERGHLGGHQADALAAVDIALWDLAGRTLGVPVHQLLGGAWRDRVPTYLSGWPGSTADRPQVAAEYAAAGLRHVKLHLSQGVEADLAVYDEVAAAAPGIRIAVDAHCSYSRADALRLGRGLDARGAWFLESPLSPEDLAGHATLTAALDTPVAVGEAFRHRIEAAEWLRRDAADLLQPDIGRTGVTEGTAVAALADLANLPILPHHSAALGVALAAGLHVAAATEHCPAFEWTPTLLETASAILAEPLAATTTSFEVPTGPGLGVTVDEETVRRLAALGR
ncbi:mandelate racemase/muconate lactonizing enzyme family protein [Micromonospora avicenniae]|uniref:mandelate racemase/muconate lactonizing enzyme family protein n=1 Tax=Micromonospora avicenniae TaxID=1198245 RepID=UPI003330308B